MNTSATGVSATVAANGTSAQLASSHRSRRMKTSAPGARIRPIPTAPESSGSARAIVSPFAGLFQEAALTMPGLFIAGGTEEIQRNIIGERLLGLPGEPRVDKDLPFNQVRQQAVTR